jgi:hypothetical protein
MVSSRLELEPRNVLASNLSSSLSDSCKENTGIINEPPSQISLWEPTQKEVECSYLSIQCHNTNFLAKSTYRIAFPRLEPHCIKLVLMKIIFLCLLRHWKMKDLSMTKSYFNWSFVPDED